MRLLHHTEDGGFQLTKPLAQGTRPRYAILSHTWLVDNGREVSFKDLIQGNAETKRPAGYHKIRFCGEQAAKDGLDYFWVDTCCINKDSSAELQEAITSMFSWYRNAAKCYAYLADVSTAQPSWELAFRQSRWFTRGWTLQELLAPASVEFFSIEGTPLGDKKSLERQIHEITEIPDRALRGHDLTEFTIAERLSWSKSRHTTRKEDKAYCLLGIFNVFIPLIYGENEYAYTRLREELDKRYAESAKLDQVLSMLPVASEAAFNSLSNQHEPTCLPDTRAELLQEIAEWADGRDDRCIFWLNGIAGTGKSTIARTVSSTHHDRGSLAATFFFSKGGGDVSRADKLITTLARQLASRIPSARRFICEAIMEQDDIANHSFRDQWNMLILGPLSKLNASLSPSTVILVVDALDECDSERDIRVLLNVFATAQSLHNPRLRILLTSRPEIAIRHSIGKLPEPMRQVFTLHEISPDVVDEDLGRFFEDNFSLIREERGFAADWPGMRVIKRLVEISCGLFIWASTACRFIREGRRLAMRRIKILVNKHISDAGPEKQLDQIYTTVLQDSIQQGYNDEEKVELYEMLRDVLGSIVVLSSPLPMESLAKLLNMPLSDIKDTLADLHTIFHIPSQTSRPIRLHHPTFRDFLLDKDRCSDMNFWVDEKQAHKVLAESCLTMMERMLKRDICDLKSPGTLLKDVDPSQIEKCIPAELQYACIYWVQHCRQSGMVFSDGDRVHRFFQEYLLYWLEAVNLMEKSAEMGAIIRLYHSSLVPSENTRQLPFVKDARRFIFSFQSIIKQAPLQTYCAALAFVTPTNKLGKHFRGQMHPWIQDIRIADAIVAKKKDEFNYVNDLAWTPDGRQIASGSNTQIARFWDVPTRAALCKFEGATDKISSVAISPDGRTIAAGSDDFTVVVWDIKTRAVRHVLKAHTGWVNSVMFSPNGKVLASGAMDETVALWDPTTGAELRRFNNQSSCVNSATFSPDGALIATGSVDQMVRLWDVSREPEELRIVLDGHSGCVNSVKFSPNGKRLISGSDDMTIRLWDTVTGTDIRTFRGHTKKVMAVTFSSDALLIVSGSEDTTVRLWDAAKGTALRTLSGHTSGINAVVFSPNGRLLASGSFDDEVRLWDTKTWVPRSKLDDFEDGDSDGDVSPLGEAWETIYLDPASPETPPPQAHASPVTCVVFSPNGQLIASSSHDPTAKLWTREGAEHHTLAGHSSAINHLAFSPDSTLLASASSDKTTRLWSTTTGTTLHTLHGHTAPVLATLFSPTGRLLATRSSAPDTTTLLWDIPTGTAATPTHQLKGHSARVTDMAFSPDGRLLATCSADATILVWDLAAAEEDGEEAMPMRLCGHAAAVNAVAFSPRAGDGGGAVVLASCSDDATVRLWAVGVGGGGGGGVPCVIIKGDGFAVFSVAFSGGDGAVVASCSADGVVNLWGRETGLGVGVLDAGVVVRRVVFLGGDGRWLETDRGVLEVGDLPVDSGSGSDTTLGLSCASGSPLAHSHALFVTQDWVQGNGENGIWLPDEYRATEVATSDDVDVLGHASGAISFVYVS